MQDEEFRDVLQKMETVQDAPKTYDITINCLQETQDRLMSKKIQGTLTGDDMKVLANVTAALLWFQSRQTRLPFGKDE